MMKKLLSLVVILLVVLLSVGNVFAAPYTETVEFDTGFFTPDEASTYSSPYYRWFDEDWGWEFSAVTGSSFTTAELYVSAWDVDAPAELDNIYLWDGDGYDIQLGSLIGLDNAWGFTTFDLAGITNIDNLLADGLKVFMDIDARNTVDTWAVALAKSVLTLDGGAVPDPEPGTEPVPEPSTIILLGGGLLGLAFARKKMKK